jgi:hypothetical protein
MKPFAPADTPKTRMQRWRGDESVMRLQYRIVRFPLQIIEERVVARMGSAAPARLFYQRSLGLLGAAVGNALQVHPSQQQACARGTGSSRR